MLGQALLLRATKASAGGQALPVSWASKRAFGADGRALTRLLKDVDRLRNAGAEAKQRSETGAGNQRYDAGIDDSRIGFDVSPQPPSNSG